MKGNKGAALVSVLITVTVLAILGAAIAAVMVSRLHLAVSYESTNGALYAAQAGIEEAKLGLKNRISTTAPAMRSDMQTYINTRYGTPGYDPFSYSRELVRKYVYDYLTGSSFPKTRNLLEKEASYSLFMGAYDTGSDTLKISSTGLYGTGSHRTNKTVTVTFKIQYTSEPFTGEDGSGGGSFPAYPLIVQGPSIDPNYSIAAFCQKLEIIGDLFLPKGITKLTSSSNSINTLSFRKDNGPESYVYIDSNLSLSGSRQYIHMEKGDMVINGSLTLGPDTNMELYIKNGDLIVTGDIILSGYQNKITVKNGNLRCGGKIYLQQAETSIDIKDCLYISNGTGNIYKTGYASTISYGRLAGYSNTATAPDRISLGDLSVFNNSKVIKTNYINRSLGSKNNPVVIFCEGDLDIDNTSNPPVQNTIDIYGIVYATGRINMKGWGSDGGNINIYGTAVTGKKLDILDQYWKRVRLEYDSHVIKKLKDDYPDIVNYFSSGTGTSTVKADIASGASSISWDE